MTDDQSKPATARNDSSVTQLVKAARAVLHEMQPMFRAPMTPGPSLVALRDAVALFDAGSLDAKSKCALGPPPASVSCWSEVSVRCAVPGCPVHDARRNDAPPCGEGNVDKTTCILVQGHDGTHYDGIGYWAGTSALKKKVSPIDPTDACATAFARPTEEDKDRARRFLAVNGTMTQGDPQSEAIVAALIRNIRVETERGRSKASPDPARCALRRPTYDGTWACEKEAGHAGAHVSRLDPLTPREALDRPFNAATGTAGGVKASAWFNIVRAALDAGRPEASPDGLASRIFDALAAGGHLAAETYGAEREQAMAILRAYATEALR